MFDKEFIKNEKVPMTRQEVRDVALGYLDIQNRKNFLDINSSTGSVSIEALIHNRDIKVTAISNDNRSYLTVLMNIESFQQKHKNLKDRIRLLDSAKPENIQDKFDSVFIGFVKKDIKQTISWASTVMKKGAGIVVSCVSIESLNDVLEIISKDDSFSVPEGISIMLNKISPLGEKHYLEPEYSGFIVKAEKIK